VLRDLLVEPFDDAAGGHVGAAGLGRDREPGRHRNPELGHLRQPDSFAAEY